MCEKTNTQSLNDFWVDRKNGIEKQIFEEILEKSFQKFIKDNEHLDQEAQ